MLIIALVLAAIGLAALVFAVVTSNALVAWVCIGASLLGVLLLIVDALRERRSNSPAAPEAVADSEDSDAFADDAAEDVAETSETSGEEAVADFDSESAEKPVTHPAD
jgi:hypothetical protein